MPRLVRLLLACLLVAGAASGGALLWFQSWLDKPGPLKAPALVQLPRGSGVDGIALRLEAAGAVGEHRLWQLAAHWTGKAALLKAGEYALEPGDSPRALIDRIAAGRVHFRKFTVVEGWRSAEIMQALAQAEALQGEVVQPPAEGTLLPETYLYSWGDTRPELMQRMARSRDDLLNRLWAQRARDLPLETPAQAVILASIIEAETPVAAERAQVAGVFINRLRRGMKLQSDPTVAYGITKGLTELDRPLTRADLAQPSAWNTYTIDALPPTPINHPGRASLTAALNPLATKALYFVADGKGGHVFAETYEQHLRNVAAYRATQGR